MRVGRREFLRWTLGTSAALASGGLLASCSQTGGPAAQRSPGATLPPPETTTVRIVSPGPCDPPLALAKEFLLEEGFTNIEYGPHSADDNAVVDHGRIRLRASPNDEELTNEVIRDLSYDRRELDPEETLRFFALRLADAKLIKSTPQQVIAQGSDFAYMRELKTELKR